MSDLYFGDELRPYYFYPPEDRQDRIEKACAHIWALRQHYGIEAVTVDWHEPGERWADTVCTITLKTPIE